MIDSAAVELAAAVWTPQGSDLMLRGTRDAATEPIERLALIGTPHQTKFIASPGPGLGRALAAHNRLRAPRERLKRMTAAVAVAGGVARTPLSWRLHSEMGLWPDSDAAENGSESRIAHRAMGAAAGIDATRALLTVRPIDDHYKPTLTLLSPAGQILGFAKLGWTDNTHEMVLNETLALSQVGSNLGPGLRATRLLGAGDHFGRPFLVTQPLPNRAARAPQTMPSSDVLRALAGALRMRPPQEFLDLPALAERVAERGNRQRADLLRRACDRLRVDWADGILTGRAHGDWVPWNLATCADQVFAWDWEHYQPIAPVGFDAFHWLMLSRRILHEASWTDSYRHAEREIGPTLEALGTAVTPRALATYHSANLVARSDRLMKEGGTEPFPVDHVLGQYLTVESG